MSDEVKPGLLCDSRQRRPVTIDRVRNASYFAKRRIDEILALAQALQDDDQRDARRAAQYCRICWYPPGGMHGQAGTARDCDHCGTKVWYTTTDTNPICKPCGQSLELCVGCCGDIEMRDRRKVERK